MKKLDGIVPYARLLFLSIFAIGAIIVGINVYQFNSTCKFTTVQFTGDTYLSRTRNFFKENHVHYTYTVKGEQFNEAGSTSSDPNEPGMKLVYYNPSNPSESYLEKSNPWFYICLGIVFAIVAMADARNVFKLS